MIEEQDEYENGNASKFINRNKKEENVNLKNEGTQEELESQFEQEEQGLIRRILPDMSMFDSKKIKMLGFMLFAMVATFGILPKMISDRNKKEKVDEVAVANPDAMQIQDINRQMVDPAMEGVVLPPEDINNSRTNATSPQNIGDEELPAYYDDEPIDEITMDDIEKKTKREYNDEPAYTSPPPSSARASSSDIDSVLEELTKSENSNSNNRSRESVDEMSNLAVVEEKKDNEYRKSAIGFSTNKTKENGESNGQVVAAPQQVQQTEHTNIQKQDDPNGQTVKKNFLSSSKNGFVSTNLLKRGYSKYELKTGHIIHGIMITGVNSDLPGEVLGQISQDVYDSVTGKYLLIPKGTKLYGQYDSNVMYGQNRLLLIWQRLIFPNGYTLELDNIQGVDMMGRAGFNGRVNNHFLKLMRSVLLSSAISVAGGALDNVNVNVDTGSKSRVSIGTGASRASENIQSIGDRLIEKDLNRQPTIYVKKGHKFNIIVNKDIVLVPYKQLR